MLGACAYTFAAASTHSRLKLTSLVARLISIALSL
jgi:hypothetical protein